VELWHTTPYANSVAPTMDVKQITLWHCGWDAADAIALHNIAVYLDANRPQTVNHTKTTEMAALVK